MDVIFAILGYGSSSLPDCTVTSFMGSVVPCLKIGSPCGCLCRLGGWGASGNTPPLPPVSPMVWIVQPLLLLHVLYMGSRGLNSQCQALAAKPLTHQAISPPLYLFENVLLYSYSWPPGTCYVDQDGIEFGTWLPSVLLRLFNTKFCRWKKICKCWGLIILPSHVWLYLESDICLNK